MFQKILSYVLTFTLVTTQAALAQQGSPASDEGGESPENVPVARSAGHGPTTRAEILAATNRLSDGIEGKGVVVSTADGVTQGLGNIIRAAGSTSNTPLRFRTPATANMPALCFDAHLTAPVTEAHPEIMVSVAAFTANCSRRLSMRQVNIGRDPNATASQLRLKQTARSMAQEISAALGGSSGRSHGLLNLMIPDAKADTTRSSEALAHIIVGIVTGVVAIVLSAAAYKAVMMSGNREERLGGLFFGMVSGSFMMLAINSFRAAFSADQESGYQK